MRRLRAAAGVAALGFGLLTTSLGASAGASTGTPAPGSPEPSASFPATSTPVATVSPDPSPSQTATAAPSEAPVAPGPSVESSTSPTTSATSSPVASLAVTLRSLRPVAPQPGDTLVLTGTVRNVSDGALVNPSIALRLGSALETRGEFEAYGDDPTGALPADVGIPATPAMALAHDRLPPGASSGFRLSVPVDRLVLPSLWQVRELGLVAEATASSGLTVSGTLRSFLPWAPRSSPTGAAVSHGVPLRVAWIWPMVDRPHRGARAAWLDATLAPELGAGGRLSDLLSVADSAAAQHHRARHGRPAVRPVPVTFAIDPLLAEDAQAMTSAYQVATAHGTVPGPGAAAARSFLSTFGAAVGHSEVIPLPYADPDVVAAARAHLPASLGVAVTSGKSILARDLGATHPLSTGWLPGGLADQRSAQAFYAAGVTSLVLSEAALPVIGGPPSETPSARTEVTTDGGDLNAVLVDSGLASDVASGLPAGADHGLATARYLAETLMIELEAPNDSRSVVLAPDRRWSPPVSYATALLSDTGRVPWIRPVTLSSVESEPRYDKVNREPLTYPASARRMELPPSYLRRVATLESSVDDFASILPAGNPVVRGFDTAVERDLSSAYRDTNSRDARVSADQQTVANAMRGVHITSQSGSFVTLTSHRGSVPVTISNDLDSQVRVVLQVEANQRLALSRDGRVTKVIPAHQQVAVDVHAAAKTSGVFPLQVRLLTPTGHQYGPNVRLNVRSTVYGTITLAITAAATGALLVAVAVRLTRRGLAARRAAGAAA